MAFDNLLNFFNVLLTYVLLDLLLTLFELMEWGIIAETFVLEKLSQFLFLQLFILKFN